MSETQWLPFWGEDQSEATSRPTFPYATKPNSLRKFLELIPHKTKPNKINADTLKAWDLKDTNDQLIIRVLKALKLVGPNNEPTDRYTEFMTPGKGPGVLSAAIREVWGHYSNIHTNLKEKTKKLCVITSIFTRVGVTRQSPIKYKA